MALKGSLQLFHPLEVLNLVKSNRETGVLLISAPGLLGGVYFVGGDILYASTAKKMYDFFTKKNFIKSIKALKEEGEKGKLWEDVVATVMKITRLTKGSFAFEEASFFLEEGFEPLRIPSEFVIMKANRELNNPEIVERKISSLQLVFEKKEGWEEAAKRAELTSEERRVLEAIDGERSVEKVIEATESPSEDVTKILFGLLCACIIGRARKRPKLEKKGLTKGLLRRLINKIRGL